MVLTRPEEQGYDEGMKRIDPADASFLAVLASNPDTPPDVLDDLLTDVGPAARRIAKAMVRKKAPKTKSGRKDWEAAQALRKWAETNARAR